MCFGAGDGRELLRGRAADYMRVALANMEREFPVMPAFVVTGPGPSSSHREMHPAFFGCFDWHSSVAMHWAAVRLLRLYRAEIEEKAAREDLNARLTRENLAAEARFFAEPQHQSIERPYGWGWLLALQSELEEWEDPDSRRWADAVRPLADQLAERLLSWLPRLTYPVRTGVHSNTAFALARAHAYARRRAGQGDRRMQDMIGRRATEWFVADTDYPARCEPSGIDFLSPALCEAELMSLVMEPAKFAEWLEAFLPGLSDEEPASLFHPADVSDPADGHIGHLHGLNLSRARGFVRLAEALPHDDPRSGPMLRAAARHAAASLPFVTGSSYAVEHWLAAYATLLLS